MKIMNDRLKQINHQLADPNDEPAEPKPAATVLLVRDVEGKGIEVFLIERAAKTNFGGAYVFPGGKVDLEDASGLLKKICKGASDKEASAALGIKEGGLAYWVACIRECFEEAGILLAYRSDSRNFDPEGQEENVRFVSYRNRLNEGEPVLAEMCKKEELFLATDRLAYLSHWITPKVEKRRYNTRFFVAQAPAGQDAIHDGSESVNSIWIKPEEALKRQEEGKLLMIMPTIKNLESICGYDNTKELLEDKNSINPYDIATIEPKFFMKDGKYIGLLPGEEGYEDH